jgi:hypothetical protein
MLPHDLTPTRLPLPPGDRDSAVLVTGALPRHLRLGYLLQRRFPGLLVRWWTCEAPARARPARLERPARALRDLLARLRRRAPDGRLRRLLDAALELAAGDEVASVEERLFGPEIEALSSSAAVHPCTVTGAGTNAMLAEIEALAPYFALTFDAPPLGEHLARGVRGLAITAHAGWAPALRGDQTVETALYHRRLEWVGTTIHLLDTAAGAGAILRRSTAALHPDDRVAHCLLAVIAAGHEMLCEVVEEARAAQELPVFPQPGGGQTLDLFDHGPARRRAVARDFRRGWFADAVRAAQVF